ncbi:TAXI family TRAP transporter solute-binding subunit [Sagittula stellata]|uniref:Immunogenic protein n=1 Tax=Sagittula stellata (strain ATCC 700073 / DSM 11524 / E-37) TaxID=388399 RepID=A3K4Q1_SAGS3|nr:TAXI family TRAP transporter solute-binding subunit [Sagittula stellata]EBA07950.1 immunogenic protein [Sagittula stellata E-37]
MKPFTRLVAALLCAASSIAAPVAAETQLNMGGSTTTSTFYPYYSSLANGISAANSELNVTVVSPGGFAANSVLMQEGDIDFGGISPDLIADAEAEGYDGFRVLWWTLPAIQNMMATDASGITDLAGFEGRCFHPGMNGSSQQKNMLRVLQALDIKPDLYMSDSTDAISALKNGRCDGQMRATQAPRLDSASAELNLTTPVHPIGYTDEQIEKIRAAMPWMGFYDMPAGVTEGSEPYTVHAVWIGFTATERMEEDMAYQLVKGMLDSTDTQAAALPAIEGVDIAQQTLDVSEYPLHAGAVRAYREAGYEVPARLLPPELQD